MNVSSFKTVINIGVYFYFLLHIQVIYFSISIEAFNARNEFLYYFKIIYVFNMVIVYINIIIHYYLHYFRNSNRIEASELKILFDKFYYVFKKSVESITKQNVKNR